MPIDHQLRDVGRQRRLQLHTVGDKQVVRQQQYPIDNLIDISQCEFRIVLLREIEQLPDDSLHPPQSILHRRQVLLLPGRRQGSLPHIVQTIKNAPEWVVDLVRNTRSQFSYRRQLLGVSDLLLQLLRVRHIAGNSQHA